MKNPKTVEDLKSIFGDLQEPPKKEPKEELRKKYPGLFPVYKKEDK